MADLARFYGRRLADLGTEKLTWPEFQSFMDHLPVDSALRRAIHGDEFVEWTQVVDLLSKILYTLQGANWQRGEGHGSEPRPAEPPVPWDQDPFPEAEED
jgi:hypothetical protein